LFNVSRVQILSRRPNLIQSCKRFLASPAVLSLRYVEEMDPANSFQALADWHNKMKRFDFHPVELNNVI